MTVFEFVHDYLETRDISFNSARELNAFDEGLLKYLLENGIEMDEDRPYFRKYVERHLRLIKLQDIKEYFISYEVISKINQIVIESRSGNNLSNSRKEDLLKLLTYMEICGLGEKYLPIFEITGILGNI